MRSLPPPRSALTGPIIGALVGVALVQYLLFRSFVLRELAWTYPLNDDQLLYLTQAYGLFDAMRSPRRVWELLSMLVGHRAHIAANGVMLPAQASLLFFVLGASRLTALTLNLVYYVLWQAVTLVCVRSFSGSIYLAAVAWSLVLVVRSPFLPIGGLTDFRGDSIALSLFGTFVAIVLASNTFFHRGRALLAGLVAGLLILFRYLGAPYLLGIYGVMVLVCGGRSLRRRRPDAIRRVVNVVLSGIVVTVVAGPSLWASRSAIDQYYVHPPHDARIWNTVDTTKERIALYLDTFAYAHLGKGFLFAATAAVVIAVVLRLGHRGGSSIMRSGSSVTGFDAGLAVSFLAACLGVPLCSFFLATAENPVVAGVMTAPTVGLITLAVGYLVPSEALELRPLRWRVGTSGILAIVLGCAAYGQGAAFAQRVFAADELPSLREIARLHDDIGRYCENAGLDAPGISTDTVRGYLGFYTRGGVLAPLYYERWGRFLEARGMVGGTPHKLDPRLVPRLLEGTDVLILNDPPPSRQEPRLPIVADLTALRPTMKDLAKTEFVSLGEYLIYGERVMVYVRPAVKVSGISGDWIPYEGIVLSLDARYAKRAKAIVLRGPLTSADASRLRDQQVLASLVDGGHEERLTSRLATDTTGYTIEILLPEGVPETVVNRLLVKVGFSRYFVPSDVYPGSTDHRKLVLWKPTHRAIILR